MSLSVGQPGHPASHLAASRRRFPGTHDHGVQFYTDDVYLLAELEQYTGAALADGDAVVVIATPEHREALAGRLQARGLLLADAHRQGRYLALDAAEVLASIAPEGWPERERFRQVIGGILERAQAAAVGKHPRVAAFGEMVSLLCAAGQYDAAICLEELWNELFSVYTFSLRCAYMIDDFPREEHGQALARICDAHSHIAPVESFATLTEEDERRRTIVQLQQKALALEAEVAERKRIEAELRRQNNELSAALAARDEFLSVAAHELKTPLTSLWAFVQLLNRNLRDNRPINPERLKLALDSIGAQAEKLNQLLRRLLDTSQIEAGRLRFEPARIDLVALMRAVLAREVESTTHRFILDTPEVLEATIDPVRFEQVITNLLDNAVKFSPQGGDVTVSLGVTAAGGVRLAVTDQGVGIPEDERERIFERFHQAHGEGHLSGLGLGLYIAREIVGLHGGTISVESPPAGGARFVVSLPPEPEDRAGCAA